MKEVSDDEAIRRFGDGRYIASLAAAQEPTKVRVVHDGSNLVPENPRI